MREMVRHTEWLNVISNPFYDLHYRVRHFMRSGIHWFDHQIWLCVEVYYITFDEPDCTLHSSLCRV